MLLKHRAQQIPHRSFRQRSADGQSPHHHRAERKDVMRSSVACPFTLLMRHINGRAHHAPIGQAGINGPSNDRSVAKPNSRHLISGRFCSRPVLITLSCLRSRWDHTRLDAAALTPSPTLIAPSGLYLAEAMRPTRANSKRQTEAVEHFHDQIARLQRPRGP